MGELLQGQGIPRPAAPVTISILVFSGTLRPAYTATSAVLPTTLGFTAAFLLMT